jgi:prepilin-type processing-associated H-X9-DG protein
MPGSFTDGTSKTFLVVEAGAAVPWTAPRDVEYDAKKPVPKLGGLLPDGFHAAMADGHVRFFKKGQLGDKTLRAAITPAGRDLLGEDFSK